MDTARRDSAESKMKNNNLYNMMHQLTQEQKSLWRLEGAYTTDAENNPELKNFWATLAEEKKKHIADLAEMINKEI